MKEPEFASFFFGIIYCTSLKIHKTTADGFVYLMLSFVFYLFQLCVEEINIRMVFLSPI